jgi:hypothetical protein
VVGQSQGSGRRDASLQVNQQYNVSCLNSFLDKISKFIWFYIPIITMLTVNLFMFTRVVKKLLEMDREKRRLNLRQADERNDKMEKLAI